MINIYILVSYCQTQPKPQLNFAEAVVSLISTWSSHPTNWSNQFSCNVFIHSTAKLLPYFIIFIPKVRNVRIFVLCIKLAILLEFSRILSIVAALGMKNMTRIYLYIKNKKQVLLGTYYFCVWKYSLVTTFYHNQLGC